MNLSCPECSTVYRIDPARVSRGGVTTRCRACEAVFFVTPEAEDQPGVVRAATRPSPSGAAELDLEPAASAGSGAAKAPVFGPQDPDTRANRLARALVSDIVVYNQEKCEQSRAAGTLRKDFRDEILKSWGEYVEQVGEERARGTPFFRDALNDILAEGKSVF